jgi:hypothetical protein
MSRGMKGVIVLHPLNKYFIQSGHNKLWSIYLVDGVWWHLSYLFSMWPHCMKYLLRGWSTMTPFIPLLTVTSLYEVFIEWMEYDDTFHTSRSQWAEVWKVSSNSIHPINTSYSEVTMSRDVKGVIILHSLKKYFIQWNHNEQRYERCHRTPFTQWILHTVRSQWAEVWKVSSYTIHSINTSYSEVTTSRGMKGVIVLHPLNKYFIQCLLTVASLYEVFIEGMEYDDTFHTSAHCDLTD